jgi:membrane protease YdiL (CAAX protease family)
MEITEDTPITESHCVHCNLIIAEDARFCNHCGLRQDLPDIADAERRQQRLSMLSVFFAIQLLICLIAKFSKDTPSLARLFLFDAIFTVVTVAFYLLLQKELNHLLKWTHFSLSKLIAYASSSVIAAILVNYAVKWVNRTIFDSETYYYTAFSHLKYAKLITILVVALEPAITEELAFRGVMQQGLYKVVDKKQAIYIAAFLFALMHLSFISFLWLFPFALWLGYVRMKEDTLWYGVVIHFCFNTTACFLEFFELHLF